MRRAVDLFRLLLALAVAPGCGGDACERRPSLTGTWLGEVIAEEPPLGLLSDVMTFEAHGTLVETRPSYVPETPLGPLLRSGGLGAWAQVGAHDYHARFTFLLQGAPDHPEFAGVLLGTDTVTLELSLDADDRLTGEFASEIRNTKGDLLFTVRGAYDGSRFTASGSSAGRSLADELRDGRASAGGPFLARARSRRQGRKMITYGSQDRSSTLSPFLKIVTVKL